MIATICVILGAFLLFRAGGPARARRPPDRSPHGDALEEVVMLDLASDGELDGDVIPPPYPR